MIEVSFAAVVVKQLINFHSLHMGGYSNEYILMTSN